MHTGRPLTSSIAAGLGGTAEALVGAPWWLTATIFALAIAGLIVAVVQLVFPQESEHRLAWWRDRRRHQQLRSQNPAPRGRRARRSHAEPASRTETEDS
ncbi:hypothetical protein ACWCQW_48030 [Streptomyces mirabilis]